MKVISQEKNTEKENEETSCDLIKNQNGEVIMTEEMYDDIQMQLQKMSDSMWPYSINIMCTIIIIQGACQSNMSILSLQINTFIIYLTGNSD